MTSGGKLSMIPLYLERRTTFTTAPFTVVWCILHLFLLLMLCILLDVYVIDTYGKQPESCLQELWNMGRPTKSHPMAPSPETNDFDLGHVAYVRSFLLDQLLWLLYLFYVSLRFMCNCLNSWCTSPCYISMEENRCIWFDLIWFDFRSGEGC